MLTKIEDEMKKLLFFALCTLQSCYLLAQIPYFAGTPNKDKLYSYTSLKVRPGENMQETYTTFQYGIGSGFASGLDLYTGIGAAYMGALLRYGLKIDKYFNIGGQVTPSFDLNNSMKFSYVTAALYMNGAITKDNRLFWCNTWWGINKDIANTISQYAYLGYLFTIKNGDAITPMLGTIYSWKFDQDADVALGFYYTHKRWNFYLWGNDYLKKNPRLVAGVDFTF